jgi:hypothetical protein
VEGTLIDVPGHHCFFDVEVVLSGFHIEREATGVRNGVFLRHQALPRPHHTFAAAGYGFRRAAEIDRDSGRTDRRLDLVCPVPLDVGRGRRPLDMRKDDPAGVQRFAVECHFSGNRRRLPLGTTPGTTGHDEGAAEKHNPTSPAQTHTLLQHQILQNLREVTRPARRDERQEFTNRS